MPYPDNFSPAAYDAAQGRDDTCDDTAERAHIDRVLATLRTASNDLCSVEMTDGVLTNVCWEAGAEIEKLVARIGRMMP